MDTCSLTRIVLGLTAAWALGGATTGAAEKSPAPSGVSPQGTQHTVTAKVEYSTRGIAGQPVEQMPAEFTIREGYQAKNLKYRFWDPASDVELSRLRPSNVYSVTQKRYMTELAENPDFTLPPGTYRFVVGGQPGATGNLTYTLVPTGPGTTKPEPPKPPTSKPPRNDKSDKPAPPASPLPPGSEEVLLLLPKNFDVVLPEVDYSKDAPGFSGGSSRGASDGPLVLRFRDGVVTADQQWTAHLKQRSQNPHIVDYLYRMTFNGTLRRGVLQGQFTFYYEGGIRALHYPEWQVWHQGEWRGQSNADGKMAVEWDTKKRKSLVYDWQKKTMVDNVYDKDPPKSRFEIRLPVGQLQASQKLSEPAPVPAIPAVR